MLKFRKIIILLCVLVVGSPALAQEDYERGGFEVDITQIGDGLYLAQRPIPHRIPDTGNVLIIINEDDVVVVDSSVVLVMAEYIIGEIRKLTDKPVSHVINTHWHGDHNLGNLAYKRAFPGVQFVGHINTRLRMLSPSMDYVQFTKDMDTETAVAERADG